REVVTSRLSRLSEQTNRVLTLASIVDPGFSAELLESAMDVSDGDDTVLDALDEAVRAGLVTETRGRYAFSHALIRHAVYAGLSSLRRCRLHRRAAEAMERLPGSDHNLEALAFHFAEAAADRELVDKAADYNLKAGQRALE